MQWFWVPFLLDSEKLWVQCISPFIRCLFYKTRAGIVLDCLVAVNVEISFHYAETSDLFDFMHVVCWFNVSQDFPSPYRNSDHYSHLQTSAGWYSQVPAFVFCTLQFAQFFVPYVNVIKSFECNSQRSRLCFNVVFILQFLPSLVQFLTFDASISMLIHDSLVNIKSSTLPSVDFLALLSGALWTKTFFSRPKLCSLSLLCSTPASRMNSFSHIETINCCFRKLDFSFDWQAACFPTFAPFMYYEVSSCMFFTKSTVFFRSDFVFIFPQSC